MDTIKKQSVSKSEKLTKLLDGCDFVKIDICNTRRGVMSKTGPDTIHLVSGIPEDDSIIEALKKACSNG